MQNRVLEIERLDSRLGLIMGDLIVLVAVGGWKSQKHRVLLGSLEGNRTRGSDPISSGIQVQSASKL